MVRKKRAPKEKIFDLLQLKSHLKKLGQSKTVFTNGVFDILHKGHVDYLARAAKLGDYLIVALNSDQSVKRLKGPSRPLQKLSDRMFVIASLECVDYVVSFSQDTPEKIIQTLSPHILVKGADYKIQEIVGADHVLSTGGKVKTLTFIKGRSTTNIIKKVRAS